MFGQDPTHIYIIPSPKKVHLCLLTASLPLKRDHPKRKVHVQIERFAPEIKGSWLEDLLLKGNSKFATEKGTAFPKGKLWYSSNLNFSGAIAVSFRECINPIVVIYYKDFLSGFLDFNFPGKSRSMSSLQFFFLARTEKARQNTLDVKRMDLH